MHIAGRCHRRRIKLKSRGVQHRPIRQTRWSNETWGLGEQKAAVGTASAAELRLGSFLCVLLHHDYECVADEGEVSRAKRQQQCRDKARGNQKNSRRPPPCFQALQQSQPSGQTQAGVINQINIYFNAARENNRVRCGAAGLQPHLAAREMLITRGSFQKDSTLKANFCCFP